MSAVRDFLVGSRVVVYSRLKRYPRVFMPIGERRENVKRRLIRRDSELVLEGYTRCGNHPALYTFLAAQGRPVNVAHHFHAPAPLIQAVLWNVPALCVVRDPLAAIPSAAMYHKMDSPGPFLRTYINFHAPLLPYLPKIVISDFPQTVGEFPSVVARINRMYGTSFRIPTGSPEEQAEVERQIRAEHESNMGGVSTTLPLPTAEKEAVKARVLARLRRPRYARRLAECQRLYGLFAAEAQRQAATLR